jgi:hypothetical protein
MFLPFELNKEFEGMCSPGPATASAPFSTKLGGSIEASQPNPTAYSFGGKGVERNAIPKQVRTIVPFY